MEGGVKVLAFVWGSTFLGAYCIYQKEATKRLMKAAYALLVVGVTVVDSILFT